MKAIYDEDSANTVALEEKHYQQEVTERKNQILKMTNPQKKQIEWAKLFPKDLLVSDMVY